MVCLLVQFNQKVFEGHNFIYTKNLTETTLFSLIWQQMALYNYWHVHVSLHMCIHTYTIKKHIAFQIMRPQKSLGSKSMMLFSLKIHLKYKCKILERFSQWEILCRREIKSISRIFFCLLLAFHVIKVTFLENKWIALYGWKKDIHRSGVFLQTPHWSICSVFTIDPKKYLTC